MGLLDSCPECREVYLVASALVAAGIGAIAVLLHVVEGKMLGTGGHPVFLQAVDEAHAHLGGQVGVFAHVLKIAAAHRGTHDVETRPQHHVHTARLAVGSKLCCHVVHQVAVPGRCAQRRGRVLCRGAVVAHTQGGIGHLYCRNAEPGHRVNVESLVLAHHLQLFLQGHLAQGVFHPLLDAGIALHLCTCSGKRCECCNDKKYFDCHGSHCDVTIELIKAHRSNMPRFQMHHKFSENFPYPHGQTRRDDILLINLAFLSPAWL